MASPRAQTLAPHADPSARVADTGVHAAQLRATRHKPATCVMSRGEGSWTDRPLPAVVRVALSSRRCPQSNFVLSDHELSSLHRAESRASVRAGVQDLTVTWLTQPTRATRPVC